MNHHYAGEENGIRLLIQAQRCRSPECIALLGFIVEVNSNSSVAVEEERDVGQVLEPVRVGVILSGATTTSSRSAVSLRIEVRNKTVV
jgi:hypothetical protein